MTSLIAIIVINRILLHTDSFCGLQTVVGRMRCVNNWKMLAFCEIRNCLKMTKFRWNFFRQAFPEAKVASLTSVYN